MKRNAEAACFLILVLFCGFSSEKCYAQAALQEIVRFNIPAGDHFSFHVETGGDISGDGRPDLVFSCIDELHYSNSPVYIYYNIPDSNAIPDQILSTPLPNSGGFGYSLAYSGDLNGDSISDLAVGVRYYGDGLSGGILIYYGGNPPFTSPDVFISGVGLGYTHDWDLFFGEDMITDCDLNGDGVNDLLVYAPGPQYENWGNVYVFLGGDPFSTTPALHIRGSVQDEYLGADMKTGDFNGDGYDDIVLTNRVPVNPGELYGPSHYHIKVYPGGDTLTNIPIYEYFLGSAPDLYVSGVIANGDLNGDGFDDIIISGGPQIGQSWIKIIYGQSDLTTLATVDYYLPDIFNAVVHTYINMDNNQYSDFWLKLHHAMPNDPFESSYLVYKQTSPILDLVYDYSDPSPQPRPSYGYCYSLGDMNNDGSPDFFVYAYPTINPPCLAYATILSESYVSNSDEYIQPARVMINCYPNPFRDGVNVRIVSTDKSIQLKSMEVFNIKGQLVYRRKNLHGKQIRWDGFDSYGHKIGSGIYVVRAFDTIGNAYSTRVVNIK